MHRSPGSRLLEFHHAHGITSPTAPAFASSTPAPPPAEPAPPAERPRPSLAWTVLALWLTLLFAGDLWLLIQVHRLSSDLEQLLLETSAPTEVRR